MILIITCIVLILVLIYVLFVRKPIEENFGDPVSVKKTPDILDLKQQFDDIITYDNDPNGRIGLDKCIEKCNGYCVEFGLTGSAYCFPAREPTVKDFNGMIVQNDRKLSFPSLE